MKVSFFVAVNWYDKFLKGEPIPPLAPAHDSYGVNVTVDQTEITMIPPRSPDEPITAMIKLVKPISSVPTFSRVTVIG
jgi:hypothetical protein